MASAQNHCTQIQPPRGSRARPWPSTQRISRRLLASAWRVGSVCRRAWGAWGSVVDGVNVSAQLGKGYFPVRFIRNRDGVFSWNTASAIFPVPD